MKFKTFGHLTLLVASSFLFVDCTSDNMMDDESTVVYERQKGFDQYIIVLDDGLDVNDLAGVRGIGKGILKNIGADQDPKHVYAHSIKGLTAFLSPGQAKKLLKLKEVISVEKDEIVTLGPPPGKGWNKDETGGGEEETTTPPQEIPWGITRVNGGAATSSNVAWILDTGIDLDHEDLNVDRTHQFTAFYKGRRALYDDGNGHGTHVAGTIGALDNGIGVIGVAPGVKVVPVKVLDDRGSGSWSAVISGVDHVAQYGSAGDVANMSLGGGTSSALDQAVYNAATTTGIRFVLAAGNESIDTNGSSPGRTNGPNIYTISASDINDNFASFSNFGSPVDYAAPGVNVLSTWKNGEYHTISGTSMATPHASGVLLLGTASTDGYVNNDPDGSADPIIVH